VVEGLQMHLREERDHRDPQAVQPALHLPEMAKAGDRRPPAIRARLTPHGPRQLPEEHLVDPNRELGLELPPKEVQLRLAALDEEHRDGPPEGGQSDAGHAQDADGHVVGGHLEGRRTDHRILQKVLAASRERAGGHSWGYEHTLAPPRRHVPAPLEILDRARHRVRIDAEEPRELSDARQRLVPRDAAALDDLLQLLRQLPANRDRAMSIHAQPHWAPHSE
jgi:hypothetical protein